MIPASVRSVPINPEPIGALRYLTLCNRGVTETDAYRYTDVPKAAVTSP